ncbi:glutathione S-transferase N-terminal domain-containing protein [Novosphingobium sp. BL-8A]|uniref:glutathione S-transferase N-terminal domain-containing protein n=1 Tax=Novosphingobium sp. BL-8A TaxID=3127639 RepID=UPI003756B69F
MSDNTFRPVLYLKATCPHCLKLRIFLLEADLLDQFEQRVFAAGDANEAAIREELAPHFEKVTFPTVQYAPGEYMNDSDAIIAHYAEAETIDRADLPIFGTYANSVLPNYMAVRKELRALKG